MPDLVNETKFTPSSWKRTSVSVFKDGRVFSDPPLFGVVNSQAQVVRNRSSLLTPQYSLLKRLGKAMPHNSFTFTRTYNSGSCLQGSLLLSRDYGTYVTTHTWSGLACQNVSVPDPDFHSAVGLGDKLRGKLINKALLKVKDEKINIGNILAERQQTISLIADTATRLFKALRSVRKGDMLSAAAFLSVNPTKRMRRRAPNVKSGVRTRDEMSGRWLELQYGWLPLLSDVGSAIDELHRGNFNTLRNRARTKGKVEDSITKVLTTAEYTSSTTSDSSVEVTVCLDFLVSVPASKSLAQIGLTNPAAIAWELTPWSFVIDWFIPIGNYIATWDATLGTSFQDGYITTFSKNVSVTKLAMKQWPHEGAVHKANGIVSKKRESISVKREKLKVYPSATLPQFKNPISTTHALNAIALLSTVFKSKVPR